MERDIDINKKLRAMNWKVIHFWSRDVLKNTEQCLTTVEEVIFSEKLEY
jgi:DNA mismatch endonuclease (patch repair protein)